MTILKSLRIIILFFYFLIISSNALSQSLEYDKMWIDSFVEVIDTIRAKEEFQRIKPGIIQRIEEYNIKHLICESLINSNQKKVKEDSLLQIIKEAYNYTIENYPEFRDRKSHSANLIASLSSLVPVAGPAISSFVSSHNTESKQVVDKNVQNGKLTADVKKYLKYYSNYLNSISIQIERMMNTNFLEFIENMPTKMITVKELNPDYRGFHYDDEKMLDIMDLSNMTNGYELLCYDNGEKVTESYPQKIEYLKFSQLPEYRVTYDKNNNKIGEVYDRNGKLVYIPILDRSNYDVFKEMKRLIYFKDYSDNKYNIKSENVHTQKFLKLWIGRKNGFLISQNELTTLQVGGMLISSFVDPFSANLVGSKILNKITDYRDDSGERFLNQLEADHSDEFGYIYIIKRMSDRQFQIIYLNRETLKPSICGIVTFSTGDEPYTSTFSVKLCDMPNDVPKAMRH